MATYKVPQDVEADDKLLGPFTFRQFIYLMIVFGSAMLAVGLFQIYPILAIIPIPIILFFGVLALPIKKDQPMETYLAALWSFYTKPNKRYWMPGQSNAVIMISAPKKTEAPRARNLSSDEAGHRLSFLAELVDTEGRAIKDANTNMKDEFYAEAYNTTDMFDRADRFNLSNSMIQSQNERRNAVVEQMKNAISQSDYNYDTRNPASGTSQFSGQKVIQPRHRDNNTNTTSTISNASNTLASPTVVQPIVTPSAPSHNPTSPEQTTTPASTTPPLPPVENVQQQADRIRKENESEVYISLH